MKSRTVRTGVLSVLLAFFIFGGCPRTLAPEHDASLPDALRDKEFGECRRMG